LTRNEQSCRHTKAKDTVKSSLQATNGIARIAIFPKDNKILSTVCRTRGSALFKCLPSLQRSPSLLTGLDISRTAIRLVELSRHGKRPLQLEHYGCTPIPDGTISSNGVEDLELLTRLSHRLWQDSGAQSSHVAIGIPAIMSVTSLLPLSATIPIDNDAQLQTLVQHHIAPLLPYSVADACIDFCLLQPSGAGHATTLFTAAVPQSIIEDLLALAEALGLEVVLTDINCYAEYAAWTSLYAAPVAAGQAVALLRVDTNGLQCALFRDACLLASQDQQAPLIQRDGNACVIKLADAAAQLLSDVLVTVGTPELIQIVLTGTNATSTGLASALQQRTRTETALAAPFSGMSFAAGIDTRQLLRQAPAYLAACGLALRQSN
jgi:type IV pilus assembly protein PilM